MDRVDVLSMARFADDKKNRVDLQDRYLQIGFEEQHVEVGNYHDFPHTRGAHLRRAEFCPTEFVEKTQEKKTVRFVSDRGDDESKTVQIPASLAYNQTLEFGACFQRCGTLQCA